MQGFIGPRRGKAASSGATPRWPGLRESCAGTAQAALRDKLLHRYPVIQRVLGVEQQR